MGTEFDFFILQDVIRRKMANTPAEYQRGIIERGKELFRERLFVSGTALTIGIVLTEVVERFVLRRGSRKLDRRT